MWKKHITMLLLAITIFMVTSVFGTAFVTQRFIETPSSHSHTRELVILSTAPAASGILLVFGGFWWITRARMARLNKTLSQRTQSDSKDRDNALLHELAGEFPELTEWLTSELDAFEKSRRGLELQVAERTAELIRSNQNLQFEVTQRKMTECELRASERMLQFIIDSIPHGIFWQTPDHSFSGCNRGFLSFLNMHSPQAVLGKRSSELDAPNERINAIDNCIHLAEETKENTTTLIHFRKTAHKESWYEIRICHLRTKDKAAIGILGVVADVTEKQLAEITIKEKTSVLSNVLTNIPLCVYWKDTQQKYLGCNNNYLELIGTNAAENIIGRRSDELADEHQITQIHSAYDQTVLETQREQLNLEIPCRDPSGSTTTYLASEAPLLDNAGNCVGVLGILTDITDHKDAQEQLRLQVAALNAAANAVVITNSDGEIIWVNAAFTRLTGYEIHEVIGKNPNILKSGEHPKPFYDEMWQTISNGSEWAGELINKHKDGSLYIEEMKITPIFAPNAAISHYVAIKQDITQRKKTAESLERIQKAVDDAIDAVAIVEKDGQTSYINIAFQEMFHCTLDMVQQAGWQSVCVDPQHASAIFDTIMDLDSWNGEIDVRSGTGRVFPAELRAAPILDEAMMPGGMLLFIHDITDRKKAERELREYADRILHANEALQTANNEAEAARLRAEQAKDELAAAQEQLVTASRRAGMAEVATGVLHNVGNVLNSVNVSAGLISDLLMHSKADGVSKVVNLLEEHQTDFAQFLTEDTRGQKIPQYLSTLVKHIDIEQNTVLKELTSLTSNIDHIRNIVTTQQAYAGAAGLIEPFAIDTLVSDAIRVSESSFGNHEIDIIQQLAKTPTVLADRQKTLQILVNLVRNAFQAIRDHDDGARQITIRTALNDESQVQIEVTDTGVGISKEHLDKVFTHGFTTKSDGHGFGLHHGALAAQEMGGSLAARSDGIGKGATFTLTLPTCETEAVCDD